MNINKRFALSAVAGLGLASIAALPAMAADVVYQEPPAPAAPMEVAPVNTWAGPYAGVSLGYGFSGKTESDIDSIETDGFLGGAFGGFNFQNGQFVYGVEGDVNYSNVKGEEAGVSSRTSVDGSIRARAGVAVTDDILVYGTAGGAAERQRVGIAGNRDTNVMLGYTVGAGIDAKLTDQVFGRVEYRYTDYGKETFDFPGESTDFESSNNRVSVGLGVKF
ncbi:outer membrane protein [Aquamicrobium sp. LC103]|uniref:outer membrane protein n=1 Tax=Aquamicrobium sp. LC103 TaxID=1120658 RepID=UPI00063ED0FE|nr:outer membrane protein [Aquamicrobium sp. LC103]TKT81374.1 porin family protein [Aquamicrobium sp. LC103]